MENETVFKSFATEAEYNTAIEAVKTEALESNKSFKSFKTEEEFTNTVKSERSKAKGEVLTELGLKSIDEIKERITKSTTLESQLTETQTKYNTLQEDYEVTKLGIKDDYKSEALTLAKARVTEEVNLAAALKAVTEKMPMMVDVVKGVRQIGNDQAKKTEEQEATDLKTTLQKKYPFIK